VRTLVGRSNRTTYPNFWAVKWDTTGQNFKDLTWFLQSASLYSQYYHLQILVHRPFIPSPRKPSPLSFPSLAICTNAARSCAHVVDLQRRRAPQYPATHFQARAAFVFNDITETRLTYLFCPTAASRVYGWYCSLVEYMGCKAIGRCNRTC